MAKRKELEQDVPLDDALFDYDGILLDDDIRKAIEQNLLLVRESADLNRIRQASYELRLGQNVEFLEVQDQQAGQPIATYRRPANGIGETLQIDPGQTVKVEVMELFNLPTNVVAHVISVGNLYKLGLSPETTYADPGFDENFYIIISNFSSRIVTLKVGEPIARVEFIKLAKSTRRPHPGARKVSEPPIWPRRVDRRLSDQLKAMGLDALIAELEAKDPPHFEHAFVAKEVRTQIGENMLTVRREIADLRLTIQTLRSDICVLDESRRRSHGVATILGMLVAAGVAVYATVLLWPHAPDWLTKYVSDGTGKGLAALIAIAIVAVWNWIWPRSRKLLSLSPIQSQAETAIK